MDLKIDLLSSNLIVPKKRDLKNIWINMWGIEELGTNRLKFLAYLFCAFPQAARLMINVKEELKEDLEVFRRVHNVQYLEK